MITCSCTVAVLPLGSTRPLFHRVADRAVLRTRIVGPVPPRSLDVTSSLPDARRPGRRRSQTRSAPTYATAERRSNLTYCTLRLLRRPVRGFCDTGTCSKSEMRATQAVFGSRWSARRPRGRVFSWKEADGDVGWSGAEFLAERFGLRVEPGARRDAATEQPDDHEVEREQVGEPVSLDPAPGDRRHEDGQSLGGQVTIQPGE